MAKACGGAQDSGILETRKSTLALSPKGAALSKDGSLSQNRGRRQRDTQGQAGAFVKPRERGRRAAQECGRSPGRERTRGLPLGQAALGSHGRLLLPQSSLRLSPFPFSILSPSLPISPPSLTPSPSLSIWNTLCFVFKRQSSAPSPWKTGLPWRFLSFSSFQGHSSANG